MDKNLVCTKCQGEMHPLEVFPGDICLDCHAAAWDAQTPAQKLAQFASLGDAFKGSVR